MNEIDFTGIEPLRLAEAKRRAAIVEEYISKEKRSVAETDKFARRMGVSRNQFYVIARAWRIYRDPARLGLKGGKGPHRGQKLDPRANAILEEELLAADDLKRLVNMVQQRCEDEGIKPLHANTIRDRFRQKQVLTPFLDGPPRVLISRAWFVLPMKMPIEGMPPMLVMATLLPERRIIAHRLTFEGPNKQAILDVILDRHLSSGEARLAGLAGLASAGLALDETVRLLVGGFIDVHRENPRLHRVLSGEVPISERQRDRIDQIRAQAISVLAAMLQGKVERPDLKATMMIDAADALTHRWFVDESGMPAQPHDMARELERMLLSYISI